jgi:hypothetical protein
MEAVRKNIWTVLLTLFAVAMVAAVIHLAGHASGTPDQVGGGTATYNPWSPSPAAVVSTHAPATPDPAAGEPEDGGSDGGSDGGGDG